MATKANKTELAESILEAVAALDETEGGLIGLQKSIDKSREILADAYGDNFDEDIQDYYDDDDEEDEDGDSVS